MAGEKSVRVRFAPSPTGYLHIGNVHTALFNWLFARHEGGSVILRIEDTDVERSRPEYEEAIINELRWLGLTWDEGVAAGGDYGPYRQSERLELYRKYAEKLYEAGYTYKCYCTAEELEAEREAAAKRGEAPRYSGRCRNLTEAECKRFEEEGRVPVYRFKVPTGRVIAFNDMIRGPIEVSSDSIGDFIVVRSNGMPTYNFSVVVDDITMGITHVIRADEHISNTPRQVLLYEALGADVPTFAHVAMLLGPDRTKLSKRHGAASVTEYKELGYLPEAIINYLAILGWAPPGEQEILSWDEMVNAFELTRVSKSSAVFDLEKLKWMNGQYIRSADLSKITDLAIPYLLKAGLIDDDVARTRRTWLEQVVDLVRGPLEYLAQLPEHAQVVLAKTVTWDDPKVLSTLQKDGVTQVLQAAAEKLAQLEDWEAEAIHAALKGIANDLGIGVGKTMRPIRAAVTGAVSGPELHRVIWLLGKDTSVARLHAALDYLLQSEKLE